MANRYWVGGTADWDSTAGSKWALTSGGAGGEAVPTTSDDVFFDAASGSVTCTIASGGGACLSFNGTGFTGTIAGGVGLISQGSVTLSSGMTVTNTNQIRAGNASGDCTLNTSGLSLPCDVVIGPPGGGTGTVTLNSSLTSSKQLLVYRSFNAGNNNITVSYFVSSNTNTRTITMGSGTWTITGKSPANNAWDFGDPTGLTLVQNTSTIKLTDATSAIKTFDGGGKTFNNVWLTGAGTGSFDFVGSNTFNDFKCDTPPHTIRFTAGTTTTVTTFTVSGSNGLLMTVQSINTSNHALVKSGGGTIDREWLHVQDSDASPVSTWYATNSSDGGDNSGWTITAPPFVGGFFGNDF